MKNYRAQTPQNLAIINILQNFSKTSTPQGLEYDGVWCKCYVTITMAHGSTSTIIPQKSASTCNVTVLLNGTFLDLNTCSAKPGVVNSLSGYFFLKSEWKWKNNSATRTPPLNPPLVLKYDGISLQSFANSALLQTSANKGNTLDSLDLRNLFKYT